MCLNESKTMKKAIIFSGIIAVCAVVIGSSVKAEEFPKPSPTIPDDYSVTLAQNQEDNKDDSSPTNPNTPRPRPSGLPELPQGYGEAGAAVITGLQQQINRNNEIIQQNDQDSAEQLRKNSARFQEFLNKRQTNSDREQPTSPRGNDNK
jgi:hypothetical protein